MIACFSKALVNRLMLHNLNYNTVAGPIHARSTALHLHSMTPMDAMLSGHARLMRPGLGSLRLPWFRSLATHCRHIGSLRTAQSSCGWVTNGVANFGLASSTHRRNASSVQCSASRQQHRVSNKAVDEGEEEHHFQHEQQKEAWKRPSSAIQSRTAGAGSRRSRHHLHGLNDEQRAAVTARVDGCVRVVAGPGSGKTRVLTHRVAHLVLEHKVPAHKILCITFTNKAASEIKSRLATMLPEDKAGAVTVGTFHGLAVKLLRSMLMERADDESGRTKGFTIFDDSDSLAVMKKLLKEDAQRRRRREEEETAIRLAMLPGARDNSSSSSSRASTSNSTGSNSSSSSTALTSESAEMRAREAEEDESDVRSEKADQMRSMVLEFKEVDMQRRLAESEENRFARRPEREKGSWGGWVERFATRYERELRRSNAFDFDDLILHAVRMLQTDEQLLKRISRQFSEVLVDEFQDTDELQYVLVCLLTSATRRAFVVGDMDQAIYGWRGAKPVCLQSYLDIDFPSVLDLQLRTNYRSQANILSLSSLLMKHSVLDRAVGGGRTLSQLATRDPTSHPLAAQFFHEGEEAAAIARTIQEIAGSRNSLTSGSSALLSASSNYWPQEKRTWRDIAVLYRKNSQARAIEEALLQRSVPSVVIGYLGLFQRRIVRIVFSYLRAMVNPADIIALQRAFIETQGYGEKTWLSLEAWATDCGMSPGTLLLEMSAGQREDRPATITSRNWNKLRSYAELFASLHSLLDPDASGSTSDVSNNGTPVGSDNGYSSGSSDSSSSAVNGAAMNGSSSSSSSSSSRNSNSNSNGNGNGIAYGKNVSSPIGLSDFVEQLLERSKIQHVLEEKAGQGPMSSSPSKPRRGSAESRKKAADDLAHLQSFLRVVDRLSGTCGRGMEGMRVFLEHITLLASETDSKGRNDLLQVNAVRLMTLHKAKGLEFPVVFIPGVEDGTLPLSSSDPEEERRLLYVGITRTEDDLFISCCRRRMILGGSGSGGGDSNDDDDDSGRFQNKWKDVDPSPFLLRLMGECGVMRLNNSWTPLRLP